MSFESDTDGNNSLVVSGGAVWSKGHMVSTGKYPFERSTYEVAKAQCDISCSGKDDPQYGGHRRRQIARNVDDHPRISVLAPESFMSYKIVKDPQTYCYGVRHVCQVDTLSVVASCYNSTHAPATAAKL